MAVGFLTLSASALAFALGPGIVARRERVRSERELFQLGPQWRNTKKDERQLDSAAMRIAAARSLTDSRHSIVALLAAITGELSDSSSITALHVDSCGGSLSILSERAASALTDIRRVRYVDRVEIDGPVASEILDGERRERASIKFTWAARERHETSLLTKVSR